MANVNEFKEWFASLLIALPVKILLISIDIGVIITT